ncbi:GNAT family N-acetyltransferase [Pseudomonas abieticivorans]|uniref:GNAT family N-acetyltransferase n=1 Tax=Pseudomonas abieticivorans TaxID=2931382 RepID=UPI0020BD8744|nr:GNAT family N-acetyltransferase [Pseudomonas sp. PIA16]
MSIHLACHSTLTGAQREQLLTLDVLPEQKAFCGDIHGALYTLLDRPNPNIRGFALLHDAVPVAFLLLKRPPFLPPWADEDAATLHALQVDARLQGRGYGRACLQALPAVARQAWPQVNQLMLSVDQGNSAAHGLYLSEGWVDTGTAYRGRVGYERRLALTLPA